LAQRRTAPAVIPRALGFLRRTGNYGRFGSGGEMKFIDILQPYASTSATGIILPSGSATWTPAVASIATGTFCQIAQGDQEYQRIGKEVVVKRVMIRGQMALLT